MPDSLSISAKCAWVFIGYCLWSVAYTMCDTPIYALSTAMTERVEERNSILSIGRLVGTTALVVATLAIEGLYMPLGWPLLSIALSVISMILMLPILFFAVRWGLGPGLLAGFVFGILQFVFDGGFAFGWQSMIGDYLIAFLVLGLAGIGHNKKGGIIWGSLLGCCARFVVHFVVGATVWASYMPEEYLGKAMSSPWIYSFLYNILYMLPSTAACIVVLAILMKPLKKYINGEDLRKA